MVNKLIQSEMKTDERSNEYLQSILKEMVNLFSISEEEAGGRINRFWDKLNLPEDQIMLYHEDEYYWAKTIFYGKNSFWWLREGEEIKPVPYPWKIKSQSGSFWNVVLSASYGILR